MASIVVHKDACKNSFRQGIIQMLENMGFSIAHESTINTLVGIWMRKMTEYSQGTRLFMEAAGRTMPVVEDAVAGLRYLKVNIHEVRDYTLQVERTQLPALPLIPSKHPAERDEASHFEAMYGPRPSEAEMKIRPDHVFDFLPAMYPELCDGGGIPEHFKKGGKEKKKCEPKEKKNDEKEKPGYKFPSKIPLFDNMTSEELALYEIPEVKKKKPLNKPDISVVTGITSSANLPTSASPAVTIPVVAKREGGSARNSKFSTPAQSPKKPDDTYPSRPGSCAPKLDVQPKEPKKPKTTEVKIPRPKGRPPKKRPEVTVISNRKFDPAYVAEQQRQLDRFKEEKEKRDKEVLEKELAKKSIDEQIKVRQETLLKTILTNNMLNASANQPLPVSHPKSLKLVIGKGPGGSPIVSSVKSTPVTPNESTIHPVVTFTVGGNSANRAHVKSGSNGEESKSKEDPECFDSTLNDTATTIDTSIQSIDDSSSTKEKKKKNKEKKNMDAEEYLEYKRQKKERKRREREEREKLEHAAKTIPEPVGEAPVQSEVVERPKFTLKIKLGDTISEKTAEMSPPPKTKPVERPKSSASTSSNVASDEKPSQPFTITFKNLFREYGPDCKEKKPSDKHSPVDKPDVVVREPDVAIPQQEERSKHKKDKKDKEKRKKEKREKEDREREKRKLEEELRLQKLEAQKREAARQQEEMEAEKRREAEREVERDAERKRLQEEARRKEVEFKERKEKKKEERRKEKEREKERHKNGPSSSRPSKKHKKKEKEREKSKREKSKSKEGSPDGSPRHIKALLTNDDDSSEEEEIWVCPVCSVAYTEGANMVCCDMCDDWFHWHCVGLLVEPASNVSWYCQRCSGKKKHKDLKRPHSGTGEPEPKRKKKY
ncbi:unnamed protein product [Caenorhabditis bovis]|uniref:PHD-type domain-containing protein n=1 Tax=Caenorhabditis bovis TaxID=2654633 RepID=A0A8S1EHN8_9PELO|nr:unnamed protein product [Caenorhabditis bovis]